MEIIQSKRSEDRILERIDFQRIRVSGTSDKIRKRTKDGKINIFDFDGGPYYNIGGYIKFEKMTYKINNITQIENYTPGIIEIVLTVSPKY